jgi:RND family efflux transporter MFP subunit
MSSQNNPPVLRKIFFFLLAVLILASGVGAFAYFKSTGPKMRRAKAKAIPTIVEVITASKGNSQAIISAMGSVVASKEVVLKARVSGEVIAVSPNFAPGGHVAQGEQLVRLDFSDYQVEMAKAKSALKKEQASYAMEQGNQKVARAELKLMKDSKVDIKRTALALREPQLRQAQASVDSAKAQLAKTKLDLERTVIKAPFNALITQRQVHLGSQVTTQGTLATLVGTDEYWVEAAIPLDRLAKLDISRPGGCPVQVSSQSTGYVWPGHTLRLTGTLSQGSRMAKMIIVVPDPLGLKQEKPRPMLMLDDYVSVKIQGDAIDNAVELPRFALRDNNTVWLMNKGKLEVRKVDLLWKESERVFVNGGLKGGEKVIVSELAAPVQGMRVMTAEQADKFLADRAGANSSQPDGAKASKAAAAGGGKVPEPDKASRQGKTETRQAGSGS